MKVGDICNHEGGTFVVVGVSKGLKNNITLFNLFDKNLSAPINSEEFLTQVEHVPSDLRLHAEHMMFIYKNRLLFNNKFMNISKELRDAIAENSRRARLAIERKARAIIVAEGLKHNNF